MTLSQSHLVRGKIWGEDRPQGTTLSVWIFCGSQLLSCVPLFVTTWTIAHWAPLSMGVLQARILEWVAMSFSRRSSWPRGQTHTSCIGRQILCHLGFIERISNDFIFSWSSPRHSRSKWLSHQPGAEQTLRTKDPDQMPICPLRALWTWGRKMKDLTQEMSEAEC